MATHVMRASLVGWRIACPFGEPFKLHLLRIYSLFDGIFQTYFADMLHISGDRHMSMKYGDHAAMNPSIRLDDELTKLERRQCIVCYHFVFIEIMPINFMDFRETLHVGCYNWWLFSPFRVR